MRGGIAKQPDPRRLVDPKDRKRYNRNQRETFLKEAGGKCEYCRQPIERTDDMRLDHRIPLAKGGADTRENLAVACKRCDYIKGNLKEWEFRHAGLGKDRITPFGVRKIPSVKDVRYLRLRLSLMRPTSRTRSIFERVLRGERVDIASYARYVNPRHGRDKLKSKVGNLVRKFDFLRMEGTIVWKYK